MNTERKYISRQEAAAIMGVHPQSISNYIERGLFRCRKLNGLVYIDREDFESKRPEMVDIVAKENALGIYKAELDADLVKVRENIRKTKRELSASDTLARTFHTTLANIMKAVARMDNLGLKSSDIEVIDLFWKTGNYASIAELLGICEQSVCTTVNIRMRRFENAFVEEANKHQVIRELYEKLALQRECIATMKETNTQLLAKLCKYENKKKIESLGGTYVNPNRVLLLATKLEDLDFSARCRNCLRFAGIHTVKDLVKTEKQDFLKLRNFGRKTLSELDDFVEDIGLLFGMSEENLKKWISEED